MTNILLMKKHDQNEEIRSVESNVNDKKSFDLFEKSLQRVESLKMYQYLNQISFGSSKTYNWEKSRSSKSNSTCQLKATISKDQSKPTLKRVLSPRNEMSPNLRKKLFSTQKNDILRYVQKIPISVQSKIHDNDERNVSACNFSLNSSANKINDNLCEFNSMKITHKDQNLSVEKSKQHLESETICTSSNEKTDSQFNIVNIQTQSAINRAEVSNDGVTKSTLSDEKSKPSEKSPKGKINISSNGENESPFNIITMKHKSTINRTDETNLLCGNISYSKRNKIQKLFEGIEEDMIESHEKKVPYSLVKCDDDLDGAGGNFFPETGIPPPVDGGIVYDENNAIQCAVSSAKSSAVRECSSLDVSLNSELLPSISCNKMKWNVKAIPQTISNASLNENICSTSASSMQSPCIISKDQTKLKEKIIIVPKGRNKKAKMREEVLEPKEGGENCDEIIKKGYISSKANFPFSVLDYHHNNNISHCDEPINTETKLHFDNEHLFEASNDFQKTPLNPSATRICQVQAEVLLSKLYQPWLDLDSCYVSTCCIIGAAKCTNLHGNKKDYIEENDYCDESFILRRNSVGSPVDFVLNRINPGVFPSQLTVQYVLLCCMDIWDEGVTDALMWLYELLRKHPPCAFGMLDYYKRILFDSVTQVDASDGIFWWCILKLEERINAVVKNVCDVSGITENNGDSYLDIRNVDETAGSSSEEKAHEVDLSVKLKRLFGGLDFMISLMEADFNIGFLKNINCLKQYTCKTGRPLTGFALWGRNGTVGTVNAKVRQIITLYFKIFKNFPDTEYRQIFKRLISLMAGVTYASERNTEPPLYPNVANNCIEVARCFSSVMIASGLNMADVCIVLDTLRPDWFRVCVCFKVLEKLSGRIMEISFKPVVELLEKLSALSYIFPSEEDISNILLQDEDVESGESEELEKLTQEFVKSATKKDKRGETKLHIACRRNNVSQVEKLLNVPSINVNAKDNNGWTPLHEAALHGNVECVKKLLNFRTPSGCFAIDLHSKNSAGITPLMDAVVKNHLEIAFELLQLGGAALLSDKNDDGFSAWDFAHTDEMKDILMSFSDCSKSNDLVGIPRILFIKLAVLTRLAIGFYIKFSEVTKMISNLKTGIEHPREGASFIKFQPLLFKQDYLEYRKLQSLIRECRRKGNKIVRGLSLYQ